MRVYYLVFGNILMPNFVYNWAIFHGCKWMKKENCNSHLVTLITAKHIY